MSYSRCLMWCLITRRAGSSGLTRNRANLMLSLLGLMTSRLSCDSSGLVMVCSHGRMSTSISVLRWEDLGSSCWMSYIDRVVAKANFATNRLLYSVSGSSPLQIETAVQLFKTLVRPILEYAAS